MSSINVDEIDLTILSLLQEDGRMTHAAIGKVVGLTGPSVYARVQRLEQSGTIKKYTALLDARTLALDVTAFIRISATHGSAADTSDFEAWIRSEPRILECHDVDGEDTYFLKVKVQSTVALRELLWEIVAHEAVTRTVTSIVLHTVKEQTNILLPGTEGYDSDV